MNVRSWAAVPVEFEVFGTSLGLALVTGALALLLPFLLALAGTLAALAIAGWCGMLRRGGGTRPALSDPGRLIGVAMAIGGTIVYLGAVPVLAPGRGLLLALALLPLWWVERHRAPGTGRRRAEA